MPDELWNEVRDTVQETGIKTIPIEKKCKKEKWLSGEALQIAVKRREGKSKGEKERYKYLNAEFQRIARRDKKAFLRDQCKEIEENNRMGNYYKKYKIGPVDAITRTMVRVRGSYALALMFKDYPDEIFVARKDSPLVIGTAEGASYLASDVPAILKYTRSVYYIGNLQETFVFVIGRCEHPLEQGTHKHGVVKPEALQYGFLRPEYRK